ncbi:MAG: hypothetical protein AUK47_22915 [Deltaproteobacteria bacterium CG2_30_63_29]|nr:MAG: hypothetical protein AUK47_22915 [Deltaproteobacteria bacterium CG2_30_63_29]PIW02662.1 MAG: Asp23/Gls24 family envelope stress response protein [Deltaproteobacteria bacterium CG17_big_fil_post_rev_8_21_14_2_50_63_7]PJB37495.1 MAG: Asp23/Gls24 family envelope stress response protein [Deltaproteobacteria bacterium CG_4_9_14_3_um_filter_63_12]
MSATKTAPTYAGQTVMADQVIETIAGVAAREVDGIYQLGKGALRHALGRVTGSAETTQGVRVEVGKKEVAIDLDVVVEYGRNIREVAHQVRALVNDRIEQMTGLNVKEVNINVVDIHFETIKEVAPLTRVE